MRRRRFYFLEPSKVGRQHLTLIEGYLSALIASERIRSQYELMLCAADATLASLPGSLKSSFSCCPVPVMNPEKRRLVLKTFVELFVVSRFVFKLRKEDFLFVSCVLPTTLWLLERIVVLLGRKRIHVVLHGEIEGIFDKSLQGMRSYGYWSNRWILSRNPKSSIQLVVLDDFIRDKLVDEYPSKLNGNVISVVHHPVIWEGKDCEVQGLETPRVCFVGYRSRFKGFDEFVRLASLHPEIDFLAIGEGKVENVSTGEVTALADNQAYLSELSKCSAALFPYSALYACSLSAAALDALSVGVKIISFDRPFFRSIASHFGSDAVTVCSSFEALDRQMIKADLQQEYKRRKTRLDRLLDSNYSLHSVQKSFEDMAINSPNPSTTIQFSNENEY